MKITVTTAAAADAVPLDEVKDHLRVTHATEDAAIYGFLVAATEAVERELGRSLITRTLRVTLDACDGAPPVRLPRGPVQSVSSFVTYAEDGSTSTVTSSNYYLTDDRLALSEVDGSDWPTFDRYYQAAYVEYVAGYGDTYHAVPAPIRQAVKQCAADYYADRVAAGMLSDGVRQMLAPFTNYIYG